MKEMTESLSHLARLDSELKSFSSLWAGGYFNSAHAQEQRRFDQVYESCIAPYVSCADVLEIGPGRGYWTKRILSQRPASITCLDALSAEHNSFWCYLRDSNTRGVQYFHVRDFNCRELSNGSIDYLFSFDVFCHMSYLGMKEYFRHLRAKLRPGANCFVMFADADKYRRNRNGKGFVRLNDGKTLASYDGEPRPGRWYWVGVRRFCRLLRQLEYRIISPDVDACPRDPICHFVL